MAVIKDAQARDMARQAVVLDLGDLSRQASTILDQARREAEKIVRDARAERERIVAGAAEQGRAQGHAEGLARGTQEGQEKGKAAAVAEYRKRLDDLAAQWTGAVERFDAAREELLTRVQRDVLELALLIAAKVTKRVIETDPGVVVEQARSVLELVAQPTAMVLAICPEDREVLERSLPALVARLPQLRHVELQEDPSVTRGSVLARSRGAGEPAAAGGGGSGRGRGSGGGGVGGGGGGEIDATIETQLSRIVEALIPGGVRGGA